MICQDRLQTNLLQLFGHTQNSEWFSIISVTGQQWVCLTIMGAVSHWTQTNSFELVVSKPWVVRRMIKTGRFSSLEIGT